MTTGTPATDGRVKRYVVCGLSSRAVGFYLPILRQTTEPRLPATVVGLLDIDQARLAAYAARTDLDVPRYRPEEFDRMVAETRPDGVIVAGPDGTHADHIIRALAHDLAVISEKPLVIDCAQAAAVLAAERASRASVRVGHNMRYTAAHRRLKGLLDSGAIGRVTNVEFVYNLDTDHGASYFRRWNRDRALSGGLTITKGCHHFDLINWLLGDRPERVFAFGARNNYGADSPHDPARVDGRAYTPAERQARCPYHRRGHTDASAAETLGRRDPAGPLPYTVQYDQARPLSIFDPEIAIEDTYSVVIRYRRGASVSYAMNCSAAWEGYQLGINGTHGRLETTHYTAPARCPFPVAAHQTIAHYPLFGEPRTYEAAPGYGGHGGADPLLARDLFGTPGPESAALGLAADSRDGAYAVAVGEAVWRSVASGEPVSIAALLPDAD
jgi:predicted dehydrogenase